MNRLAGFWQTTKAAGADFMKHRVFKLSASLAFYTILSIGPMLLVIIFISNLFWGRQAIEGRISRDISGAVGDETALLVQEIIKNAYITGNNLIAAISFILLILTATSVFSEIQISMNMIWNLKVKKGRGLMQMLKNKLMSFSIVSGLGFVLVVSLIISGLLDGFMARLVQIYPDATVIVIYIVQLLVTLLVETLLFAFIFKVLPDAFFQWRHVWPGALFAAVLFMIGKFFISLYLNNTNISSSYGTAGSLVVLMLWVYYSSAIFYFGAVFTKAYIIKYGPAIVPKPYAVAIRVVEQESGAKSVQENERDG